MLKLLFSRIRGKHLRTEMHLISPRICAFNQKKIICVKGVKKHRFPGLQTRNLSKCEKTTPVAMFHRIYISISVCEILIEMALKDLRVAMET